MSIAPAEKEIARFLANERPEVLCFKGKWGVGKTYAWNTFLKEAKERNGIALRRYSYVSLFGLGSIDQLKLSIVENTTARERIGDAVTLESILANPLEAVGRWRRLLTQLQIAPLPGAKEIAAAIQSSSFLSVRDQIVCLDDLERKGDALKIKDVLGLVSFLKEDRRCKVAVILNDGAFAEMEKEDFERFFEKTIDSHVDFAPTPQECARIALPGDCQLHATMRTCCEELQICNIRVVKRIERLGLVLGETLSVCDARVLDEAYRVLTLIGWSLYEEAAAPIEFIAERHRRRVMAVRGEEPSEAEKKWGVMLDAYKFHYFSEFDKLLREGVERGYFDVDRLKEEAATLEARYAAQELESEYHAAWRIYHDSFDDNEAELVEKMYQSFKEGCNHIDAMNANSTITLMRELGHDDKADELVKYFVENVEDDRVFDRSRWFSEKDVSDPALLDAIAKRRSKVEDARKPLDVLTAVAKRQGWNREDVKLLSELTSEDYYKMFKEVKGEELDVIVRMALSFGQGEREQGIATMAREALVKIGQESKLNERRVGKFGIKT
jgi:hypothetical protein